MGIDYIFLNEDKKEYVSVSRDFENDPDSLKVLYLMKYEWRGDKVRCIADLEEWWNYAYDECTEIFVREEQ